MNAETEAEYRDDIEKTLRWFDITDQHIYDELKKTPANLLSGFLQQHIGDNNALIDHLYASRTNGGVFPSPDAIKFRGLLYLCFQGELSSTTWDNLWNRLDNNEKLVYSTYNANPLYIAAYNSNFSGLKKISDNYNESAKTSSHRQPDWQFAIYDALRQLSGSLNKQKIPCYIFLLDLCIQSATLINPELEPTVSNKQFRYKINNIYLDHDNTNDAQEKNTTSLIQVFVILMIGYFENKATPAISLLSTLLQLKLPATEFATFKKFVDAYVTNRFNTLEYLTCCEARLKPFPLPDASQVKIEALQTRLNEYAKERQNNKYEYSGWGSFFSLHVFGYSKTQKLTAVRALLDALESNKTLDSMHKGPLSEGKLGRILKTWQKEFDQNPFELVTFDKAGEDPLIPRSRF